MYCKCICQVVAGNCVPGLETGSWHSPSGDAYGTGGGGLLLCKYCNNEPETATTFVIRIKNSTRNEQLFEIIQLWFVWLANFAIEKIDTKTILGHSCAVSQ